MRQTNASARYAELADLLRLAQRRIHRAIVPANILADRSKCGNHPGLRHSSLHRGRNASTSGAGDGRSTAAVMGAVGGVAIISLAISVLPQTFRKPGLLQTAQRLDLAAGDQNRVATALELLTADQATPFTLAAIADGVAIARSIQTVVPVVPETQWKWKSRLGHIRGMPRSDGGVSDSGDGSNPRAA